MDLVRKAGIDVTDWGNYARGETMAAMNPRYCYEWAFVDPGKVAVLNIWHSGIREHRGVLELKDNLRASALRHAQARDGASPVWRRRAAEFDEAVKTAALQSLPVRAVICDGSPRRIAKKRASRVTARMLDPVPWAVTSYDSGSGAFTLTRGAIPTARLVDQFVAGYDSESAAELRTITGTRFSRALRVRMAALERAQGKCELCGQPGFVTANGDVFLETHHIIPLSEGGADSIENVVAMCPNHHREAHYGAARKVIREQLSASMSITKHVIPKKQVL